MKPLPSTVSVIGPEPAAAGHSASFYYEQGERPSREQLRGFYLRAAELARSLPLPGRDENGRGTVIEGRSEIDQSLITGETLYVTAEQGTPVYAGSMNISGTLRVRVSAASEATPALLDALDPGERAIIRDVAAPAKARPAQIVMASMATVFFILFTFGRFLSKL